MDDQPKPDAHGEGAPPEGEPGDRARDGELLGAGLDEGNVPEAGAREHRHHDGDASETFSTVDRKFTGDTVDPHHPVPRPHAERATSPGPPARRSLGKTVGRVVLTLLSVTALTATGIAWATIGQLNESTNTTNALEEAQDAPEAPPENDGATDILLVGNDSRYDSRGNPLPADMLKALRTEATNSLNTDTLILLRIPHNGGRGAAVSIPRDSYVKIAGGERDKINAAFAHGKIPAKRELRADGLSGAQLERESDQAGRISLVRTIQELTGVRVDHYAEVNLLGFYLLTKAVGGVEVCLNNAVNDKNSGAVFPAGRQTVSGGEALSFVRQRHGIPGGDLGRIKRQQAFLASAVNKLLSAGTLTDRTKLNDLADAVSKSVVLDPNLDIFELAGQARRMAAGTVKFVTIPVGTVGARDDRGRSIVTLDRGEVRRFVGDLLPDTGGKAQNSGSTIRPSTGAGDGSDDPGDGGPSGPGHSTGLSAPPSSGTAGGGNDRFAAAPQLRLDGPVGSGAAPAVEQEPPTEPIVADGVPCVD